MESNNGFADHGTHTVSSPRAFPPRTSVDAGAASLSPRLRKKRSTVAVRRDSQIASARAAPSPGSPIGAWSGDGARTRKASFRDTLRKILRRKSKVVEPPGREKLPRREPEPTPPRAVSAPHQIVVLPPPPSVQRTRSPYAVEFPQSARLKPLNLGNPFATPTGELRRRKTLPNVLLPASDAAATAPTTPTDPLQVPPIPSRAAAARPARTPSQRRAANDLARRTAGINPKRRSRSVEDLRTALDHAGVPRKRSEEIRYWRDSLRESGLHTIGSTDRVRAEAEDETPARAPPTPPGPSVGPLESAEPGPAASSPRSFLHPHHRHGPSLGGETDIYSASGYGTELSRDLEDRVAKLEAGLHTFQRSLHRMTTERNRRTVLVGGVPHRPLSTDDRTPSMLADTLQDPFERWLHPVDFDAAQRPSTSPRPAPPPPSRLPRPRPRPPTPRRPPPDSPSPPPAMPPIPLHDRHDDDDDDAGDDPFISRLLGDDNDNNNNDDDDGDGDDNDNGDGGRTRDPAQPPPTFQALYQMLAAERSARRRLEEQLLGLRREITDLQSQVSTASPPYGASARSSRHLAAAPADPVLGSSRLRDLLRDMERSPPPPPPPGARSRGSGATTFSLDGPRLSWRPPALQQQQHLVSRFSASESEGGPVESVDEFPEGDAPPVRPRRSDPPVAEGAMF